ncbi:MAG: hypothetical protein P8O72_04980 [Flavobacteriaceae bacterium]|nr:hypothetical protein [Flavobacteriaceae bacterium]
MEGFYQQQVTYISGAKQNESDTVQIVFKNIARKTIELTQPIEEQQYISYQLQATKIPVYIADKSTSIKKENEYNYKRIQNEESIRFSFPINQQMMAQLTLEVSQHQVFPSLILSDIEFPLERNDYNLYIEASTN